MVILAIITSLFIAIQDPIIQKFAVRFAGGYLSEKTGADIKVGRLVVTPDFRVLVEDVSVKDLKGNDLAKIEKLSTRIDVPDLLDGKLHLEKVELQNTEANLIQYEGEDQLNFAFLADAFKSDKEKPEKDPMPIIIDKISLKDVDFTFWNQNSDHPEKTDQNLMDYSHLVLKDINLEASNLLVLGDDLKPTATNVHILSTLPHFYVRFSLHDSTGKISGTSNATRFSSEDYAQINTITGELMLPATMQPGKYELRLYYYVSNPRMSTQVNCEAQDLYVVGHVAKYGSSFQVDDVVSLIDYVLSGEKNNVDVQDVTKVIECVLTGNLF